LIVRGFGLDKVAHDDGNGTDDARQGDAREAAFGPRTDQAEERPAEDKQGDVAGRPQRRLVELDARKRDPVRNLRDQAEDQSQKGAEGQSGQTAVCREGLDLCQRVHGASMARAG
jgi:hypothetical protein